MQERFFLDLRSIFGEIDGRNNSTNNAHNI